MREWLVIESSKKNAIFVSDEARSAKGYIPRDTAETLLGRDLSGTQWFTQDESKVMRAHREWKNNEPE